MQSKLTEAHKATALELSKTMTSDQITAELKRRGVSIHPSNIRRFLAKVRGQTTEAEVVESVDETVRRMMDERPPLPAVPERVKTTRIEDMGFDTAQQSIALFSDLHYGSRIDQRATGGYGLYNIDIARERLARWRDALLRLHQMDSVLIDIPTLNIFALGDDIEGHGDMFPTQKLQMDASVIFQQLGFVEDMSTTLLDLLTRYEKINIFKVYGNHGRIAADAKGAYGPDNLEIAAWEHIADRVARQTGGDWSTSETGIHSLTGGQIDFHISKAFFIMAEIEGQLIYARHGHRIGGLNRTYTGAIDNMFRMNAIIGDNINYMFKAHLHEAQEAEPMIGGQVIQNGCFVGASMLSLEGQRASASIPSQELYLIHPVHGLTHHHRVRLATPDEVRGGEVYRQDSGEWEIL